MTLFILSGAALVIGAGIDEVAPTCTFQTGTDIGGASNFTENNSVGIVISSNTNSTGPTSTVQLWTAGGGIES